MTVSEKVGFFSEEEWVVEDGGGNHFRLKTISWTVVLPAKIVGEMVTIFFHTVHEKNILNISN